MRDEPATVPAIYQIWWKRPGATLWVERYSSADRQLVQDILDRQDGEMRLITYKRVDEKHAPQPRRL